MPGAGAHLPAVFNNLMERLRHLLRLGARVLVSTAAAKHRLLRREQGDAPVMMARRVMQLQVSCLPNIAVETSQGWPQRSSCGHPGKSRRSGLETGAGHRKIYR